MPACGCCGSIDKLQLTFDMLLLLGVFTSTYKVAQFRLGVWRADNLNKTFQETLGKQKKTDLLKIGIN